MCVCVCVCVCVVRARERERERERGRESYLQVLIIKISEKLKRRRCEELPFWQILSFYLLIISASFYLFYFPLTLLLCGAVQFNCTSFSSAFLWFSILLYFSTLFTFVGVGVSLFYGYSFTLKIGVSVISFFPGAHPVSGIVPNLRILQKLSAYSFRP